MKTQPTQFKFGTENMLGTINLILKNLNSLNIFC